MSTTKYLLTKHIEENIERLLIWDEAMRGTCITEVQYERIKAAVERIMVVAKSAYIHGRMHEQ